MYHGNLWLSNLAIEGEGADAFIAAEYPRVIDEYMKRAVYPDGSAMEDGYVVNLALREGSNVLVAAEKRGRGHIASQKFRNLVYHVAHMYEPWACAECAFPSGRGEMRGPCLPVARAAEVRAPAVVELAADT
jgi:hypothetical protein